jgi:hypothetical protein
VSGQGCVEASLSPGSLSSFVGPYYRSPLPTPEEQCRSRPSIKTYLRVRLDSMESTMSGGEDCESRSFVTGSVRGHSHGALKHEARRPARGRLRGRLLLRSRLRSAVGGATPPQRTAGLSWSDQGNKLGAPKFCQVRSISSSLGGCTGIPKGVHSCERLTTGWRNA